MIVFYKLDHWALIMYLQETSEAKELKKSRHSGVLLEKALREALF